MAAMIRSLSSGFDLTRMWRRIERVNLEKERLDNVQPRTMLGREGEFEASCGLFGEPGVGFLGNVGGVIVKDDLDRSMRRIGRVNNLEKFDELAAAMPVPDQGVNLPGQQIDAGQKADGAMALVFMITPEGRMRAGLRRQIGG